MLADAGASAVILGHSERRNDHGETSQIISDKAVAAHEAGLLAIVCTGESDIERKWGQATTVVAEQLRHSLPKTVSGQNTVIAYEPVWAIGTGLTPTTDDIAEMHGFIREVVSDYFGPSIAAAMRIIYGGSVKPGNASQLLKVDDVDGALVGGASLKASDFLAILGAYSSRRPSKPKEKAKAAAPEAETETEKPVAGEASPPREAEGVDAKALSASKK
jgi:triosephosphate isomerase